jgi:hypothetical protein
MPHRAAAQGVLHATAPAWPDTVGWRVDSTPELVLGKVDTDLQSSPPGQAFSDVRGAVRLSDGRIIGAEAATQELRVFDSTGVYLGAWGRRGGGPGEFRGLDGVFVLPGDTVITRDLETDRITDFDSSGSVVTTFEIPRDEVFGATSGSGILSRPTDLRDYSLGVHPPHLQPILILGRNGRVRTALGRDPTQGRDEVQASRINTTVPFVFSVGSLSSSQGAVVAIGDPDSTHMITLFQSMDAQPKRIAWPLPGVRHSAEDLAAWKDRVAPPPSPAMSGRFAEVARLARQLAERTIPGLPVPDALPSFDRLEVDGTGNVWAEDYPNATLPDNRWEVFDSTGTWLGHVAVPRMKKVYQIGRDFILGINYGKKYGEPQITLYRIRRTAMP